MATIQEIEALVRAKVSIIWINSYEERRIFSEILKSEIIGLEKYKSPNGEEIEGVAQGKVLFLWSGTQGLVQVKGEEHKKYYGLKPENNLTLQPVNALEAFSEFKVPGTCSGAVCIMRDFHTSMTIPMPGRKLRDIATSLSRNKKTIIIIGPSSKIPDEVQKDIYLVDYDFPDEVKVRDLVSKIGCYFKGKEGAIEDDGIHQTFSIEGKKRKYKVKYTEDEIKDLTKACLGLTQQEITFALSKSIQNTPNGELLTSIITQEKKNIIRKSQVLEYWAACQPLGDVGGNAVLKEWLIQRGSAFNGFSVDFGVRLPKGTVLVGVQGCGKSMLAKAIAGEWKLPLIKLDMGRVFAGLVGSSEKNMRDAIMQAEACAPVVLWIDEIEKGVSGTSSSNTSDGGTTSRVFGSLTTWLQEKTKPVFVIATANDVTKIPPELLRKGRIDNIWFVDLPTEEERVEIFTTHIRRIGRDPTKFNVKKLASIRYEAPEGGKFDYSGSEIEEAINDALNMAYIKNSAIIKDKESAKALIGSKKDVTTDMIAEAVKDTIPISCTADAKVKKIREWGRKHAKFASHYAEVMNSTKVVTKKGEKNNEKSVDIGEIIE